MNLARLSHGSPAYMLLQQRCCFPPFPALICFNLDPNHCEYVVQVSRNESHIGYHLVRYLV